MINLSRLRRASLRFNRVRFPEFAHYSLSTKAATSTIEQPESNLNLKNISFHPLPWTQPDRSEIDAEVVPSEISEKSKRCGAYAIKVGMTNIWDSWGERHAVTLLHIDACQILQVITKETNGYTALQVGAGEAKPKNVQKSLMGLFKKSNVPPKRKIGEFHVTPDAILPVGFRLRAQHFIPGQLIDVQGTTKGKGFQGGMKRWNFKGQRASHGVSKTHRHIGSTGQCQDPGRVFKGKKMPGRMGGVLRSVQCLRILKVDTQRDLLFVKGHVPGNKGNFVRVQDAIRRPEFPVPPPFPSYVPPRDASEEIPLELFAPVKDVDPMGYMG